MITGQQKSAFVTSFPTTGMFRHIKKIPLKNCTNTLIYPWKYKNKRKKMQTIVAFGSK
jgi:hypothetical protein